MTLPHALTKRLVNHAPPNDVTEGYAADWTIGQLREPAQHIANRIEELTGRTIGKDSESCTGVEIFDDTCMLGLVWRYKTICRHMGTIESATEILSMTRQEISLVS